MGSHQHPTLQDRKSFPSSSVVKQPMCLSYVSYNHRVRRWKRIGCSLSVSCGVPSGTARVPWVRGASQPPTAIQCVPAATSPGSLHHHASCWHERQPCPCACCNGMHGHPDPCCSAPAACQTSTVYPQSFCIEMPLCIGGLVPRAACDVSLLCSFVHPCIFIFFLFPFSL